MNRPKIDASQETARILVDALHAHAKACDEVVSAVAKLESGNPLFWEQLRDDITAAACLIDGYQAGLDLATPHESTGYKLVPAALIPGVFVLEGRAAA